MTRVSSMFNNCQLVIHETMHGWINLAADNKRRGFSFTIRASTSRLLNFSAPRAIEGSLHIQDFSTVAVRGELTLALTGPKYSLHAEIPGHGLLHFSGHKTYQLHPLKKSLTTCPMTVFAQDREVGHAEVVYRDSILLFPVRALRLQFGR